MKYSRKDARNVLIILASSVTVVFIALTTGIRINLTDSHVPVGLWRTVHHTPDSLQVGDIVTFDIYKHYLSQLKVYDEKLSFVVTVTPIMMKRIAALPGSLIERSEDHLLIDGVMYENAPIRPPYFDKSDPCKVEYPVIVPPLCVWIMADTFSAYDSRYYGVVSMDIIEAKVKKVLVW